MVITQQLKPGDDVFHVTVKRALGKHEQLDMFHGPVARTHKADFEVLEQIIVGMEWEGCLCHVRGKARCNLCSIVRKGDDLPRESALPDAMKLLEFDDGSEQYALGDHGPL